MVQYGTNDDLRSLVLKSHELRARGFGVYSDSPRTKCTQNFGELTKYIFKNLCFYLKKPFSTEASF